MKITIKDMILVSLFTALTIVGAFIKVPLGATSLTLQFLFTALAGIMLGSKLGALSQLIYVFIGLIGIPVFTKGGGLSYIFQPSFGYLIGFIFGSYVIGKIIESSKDVSFIKIFMASVLGLAIIYMIGVPYLYIVLKTVNKVQITMYGALKSGLLLFLPGDFIKCVVTAIIGVKIVPVLKRQLSLR